MRHATGAAMARSSGIPSRLLKNSREPRCEADFALSGRRGPVRVAVLRGLGHDEPEAEIGRIPLGRQDFLS